MGEPSGTGKGESSGEPSGTKGKIAADGTRVDAMQMQALSSAIQQVDYKKQAKEKYAFWETQPVSQFKDSVRDVSGGNACRVCRRLPLMHTRTRTCAVSERGYR
jgi:hypothetical protein